MTVTLAFLHGWGFGKDFWSPLRTLLPEWLHAVDDRGYFCAQHDLEISGPAIAVAHSFGTMRLLAQPPAGLAGLVAINGFTRFCADETAPGVPPRIVAQMRKAMAADPARVVQGFRAGCGIEDGFSSIDPAPLSADLDTMQSASLAAPAVPVLSLEGARDHLLDRLTRDAQFPGAQIERAEQADGGHMLPLTHPEWCAQHIRRFAEGLRA